MILLDTNVLSELIRREPDEAVTQWLDSLDAATVATTAITAAELLYGVARLPAGRRKEQLSEAIRGLIEEDLNGRVRAIRRDGRHPLRSHCQRSRQSRPSDQHGRRADSSDLLQARGDARHAELQ